MKLTIEGTESEIKNVLQAIGSSKEHDEFKQIDSRSQPMTKEEYEKSLSK